MFYGYSLVYKCRERFGRMYVQFTIIVILGGEDWGQGEVGIGKKDFSFVQKVKKNFFKEVIFMYYLYN